MSLETKQPYKSICRRTENCLFWKAGIHYCIVSDVVLKLWNVLHRGSVEHHLLYFPLHLQTCHQTI